MSDDTNRAGDEPGGTPDHSYYDDVFPEAGKKCVTCGGKWLAFGRWVTSPYCPFCGDDAARDIRPDGSTVTTVTRWVPAT